MAKLAGEGERDVALTAGRSLIAAGVTVRGDIEGPGDLVIEGRVVGRVEAVGVLVSEHAEVEGPISAEIVEISGKVNGSVQAASVQLRPSAQVDGDVSYKTLQVEGGARFSGRCVFMEAEEGKVVSIGKSEPAEDKVAAADELAGMAARLRRVVEPRSA